jgi:uridine kinase
MPDRAPDLRSSSLQAEDLAEYVGAVLRGASDQAVAGPLVAAIGGYPCIGKTGLAVEISAHWKEPSFVLPTESVIRARSARLSLGQDGSAVESHDLIALVAAIRAIREGARVTMAKYSWQTGDFAGTERSPALGTGGLLLVDGSVATTRELLPDIDIAFALRPASLDDWLEVAVARDVAERNWDLKNALSQNAAKGRTVAEQLAFFGQAENEHLLIVPVQPS